MTGIEAAEQSNRGQPHLPQQRLIVLGASNCARGLPQLVDVARQELQTPLELLAAIGHGRSYRNETLVVIRRLPGILSSGLWQALAERENVPGTALLTDIGNDLLYGAEPQRIADWVDETFTRLAPYSSQSIVTLLPLERVRQIGTWQFRFFRSLFFPACQLSLLEALQRAEILNQLVADLAKKHKATLVLPNLGWYGLDPIHIKRSQYATAWQTMLQSRHQPATPAVSLHRPANHPSSLPFWQRWTLGWSSPYERKLFGITQQTSQPVVKMSDGTTLSLF